MQYFDGGVGAEMPIRGREARDLREELAWTTYSQQQGNHVGGWRVSGTHPRLAWSVSTDRVKLSVTPSAEARLDISHVV